MTQIGRRDTIDGLQMQHDNTVATVGSRNRIRVCTLGVDEALRQGIVTVVLVEAYISAFTNRVIDVRHIDLMEVDIQIIDAIQRIEGNQCVIVMQRVIRKRGGVLLFVSGSPFMGECLVERRADIQRVAEDMGLMNGEVQHNGTVATGSTMHRVAVDTRYYE